MCLTRAMHFSAGASSVRAQQAHAADELVQHELQPQLGGLVLDDEQQLVVVLGRAQRMLRGQQRVELEVAAVAHAVREVGDDGSFDRPAYCPRTPSLTAPVCSPAAYWAGAQISESSRSFDSTSALDGSTWCVASG